MPQWHTAAIAWIADTDVSDAATLTRIAAELAGRLGATRPLTTAVGARDLWVWSATPDRPDLTALHDVTEALRDNGIHVAVGAPAAGHEGFARSHLQARAVQQLILPAACTPHLVCYPDVEMLCLTVGNDPLVEAMVAREIGPLCGDDKNLEPIRETLSTFLATRNVEETASALFVHKNTVRYRLSKAEELLGHPLAVHATEVDLALRYVALFGTHSAL